MFRCKLLCNLAVYKTGGTKEIAPKMYDIFSRCSTSKFLHRALIDIIVSQGLSFSPREHALLMLCLLFSARLSLYPSNPLSAVKVPFSKVD